MTTPTPITVRVVLHLEGGRRRTVEHTITPEHLAASRHTEIELVVMTLRATGLIAARNAGLTHSTRPPTIHP